MPLGLPALIVFFLLVVPLINFLAKGLTVCLLLQRERYLQSVLISLAIGVAFSQQAITGL